MQTLTFKDVEWAFGGSGTTHVVRMAGGTVGDVSVRASGLPVFESGHRYALLLAQGGDLAMPFTQGENGAWQVVISGFGDELLVSSPGEVLLETATGGVRAARWFPNASSAAEMSALAPDFERSLTVRRWLSLVSGRAQVTVMPSVPSVEGNISVEGGQ